MTTLREAAEMALEALEAHADIGIKSDKAIFALREALEQPEREPVAWTTMPDANDWTFVSGSANPNGKLNGKWYPLYATPPQRKPLTDEEIDKVTDAQWAQNNHKPIYAAHRAYARAIEQEHGIEGEE